MRIIGGTSGDMKPLYCADCGMKTRHFNDLTYTHNMGVGFALSVISCGLFLPVWIYIAMRSEPNRYCCEKCGKAVKNFNEPGSMSGVTAP